MEKSEIRNQKSEIRLGVIGTGHIGAHMIKMAKGFGMKVVGFDAFPNAELSHTLDFAYLPLNELQSTLIELVHEPSGARVVHGSAPSLPFRDHFVIACRVETCLKPLAYGSVSQQDAKRLQAPGISHPDTAKSARGRLHVRTCPSPHCCRCRRR